MKRCERDIRDFRTSAPDVMEFDDSDEAIECCIRNVPSTYSESLLLECREWFSAQIACSDFNSLSDFVGCVSDLPHFPHGLLTT
jgi:predicted ATPase